jgi:hypothetical protein
MAIQSKQKRSSRKLSLEDEEYVRRATAAWFRTGGYDHPSNISEVEEHKGKFYVVLRNVNGVLAVYRIRNDEMLKRLKRWPGELEGVVKS